MWWDIEDVVCYFVGDVNVEVGDFVGDWVVEVE